MRSFQFRFFLGGYQNVHFTLQVTLSSTGSYTGASPVVAFLGGSYTRKCLFLSNHRIDALRKSVVKKGIYSSFCI